MSAKNFALIGAAGYIAPRHMKAICDTGNNLVAAFDPSDSVGRLDQFGYDIAFFTEFERFDRHAEKLRRAGGEKKIDFVSICSPNYLHDAHIRFALRIGADAICEKPLVLNPWNIDALSELEKETGKKVYNVLQLRTHPSIIALRERIQQSPPGKQYDIELTTVTSRGRWYFTSWKGDLSKSGGIATNIGVHLFDMLLWIFGDVRHQEVHLSAPEKMGGYLEFEKAKVRWFLSVDHRDLPESVRKKSQPTFRSITFDGEEIEFSGGFTDLHTAVYRDILAGKGYGIEDARLAINLVHELRNSNPVSVSFSEDRVHPFLSPGHRKD